MDRRLSLKPEEIKVGDEVYVVGYGWNGNIIEYKKTTVKIILKTKIILTGGLTVLGIKKGFPTNNIYPIGMGDDIEYEIIINEAKKRFRNILNDIGNCKLKLKAYKEALLEVIAEKEMKDKGDAK